MFPNILFLLLKNLQQNYKIIIKTQTRDHRKIIRGSSEKHRRKKAKSELSNPQK